MRILKSISSAFVLVITCSNVGWAAIVADYSHDSFFSGNAIAKAALEKAIFDINSLITSSFSEITTAQDSVTGTNGPSTATLNHRFSYSNPTTGAVEQFNGGVTALPANEIRIFVGMRNLSGNTLGQGGPGGIGLGISGGGTDATFQGALTNASNLSTAAYRRGGEGPLISKLNGSFNFGATVATYEVEYGNSIGAMWFDQDTDNNGIADSASTLSSFWNFDHTLDSFGSKADFYSVALHETLHAIGFGTSETWDDLVTSGTNWAGANVISEVGTGVGVISDDGLHVASGLLSARLSDGVLQQTVMSPSILFGTRKSLTFLDAMFLKDLGFRVNTTAVPEPGSLMVLSLVLVGGATIRRRRVA